MPVQFQFGKIVLKDKASIENEYSNADYTPFGIFKKYFLCTIKLRLPPLRFYCVGG
jgi:hypothetical protein